VLAGTIILRAISVQPEDNFFKSVVERSSMK
jgi:hypothetical protein